MSQPFKGIENIWSEVGVELVPYYGQQKKKVNLIKKLDLKYSDQNLEHLKPVNSIINTKASFKNLFPPKIAKL